MQCPSCGNEVHGKFCSNCGARMPQEPAAGDAGRATQVLSASQVPDMAGSAAGTVAFTPEQAPGSAPPQPGPTPVSPAAPAGYTSPAGTAAAGSGQPAPAGADILQGVTVPDSVQQRLAPLERFGKQYVAWAGCVLLLIGLFVSAKTYTITVSILGISASQSLWDYAKFWAVILLLLIAASAALAYLRDYRWLLITGAAALAILLLNFIYAFSTGGLTAGYDSAIGSSAHPSWGWILLFPGALLILAAGAMRASARDAADEGSALRMVSSLRNR